MPNITATKMRTWLANAAEGETITYFRGFLALAKEEGNRSLGEADRRELFRVGDYLWRAAQLDRVHLVQIRHGVGDSTYVAVARGQRLAKPACSAAAATQGSPSSSPSVKDTRQLRGRGQRLLEAH
jgi:hypothetical protein